MNIPLHDKFFYKFGGHGIRMHRGDYDLFHTLRWRHNERDCVSNHQPSHCLLNRLFGRRSKKTSKLRVTGLCAVNSPGTGEFSAQMASNAENVSIWWRHHDKSESLDTSSMARARPYRVRSWLECVHNIDSSMATSTILVARNTAPIEWFLVEIHMG